MLHNKDYRKGKVMRITSGSTLFVRSDTLSSRVIAWATRAKREGPTLATHQGKIMPQLGYDDVIEASSKKGEVIVRCLNDAVKGMEFAIVAPRVTVSAEYVGDVYSMVGWKYSHKLLPLYLIDGLLSKMCGQSMIGLDVIVARKLMKDKWDAGVVCALTGNRVDIKYGLLPEILKYASPDDTWDWVSTHPDMWEIVCWSEGWYK